MRISKRLAPVALAALACAALPATAHAQVRRTIPVYDLERPAYDLAVGVAEQGHGDDAVAAWSEVLAGALPAALDDATARALFAYLRAASAGDVDSVRALYAPSAAPKKVAEMADFVRQLLSKPGPPERIRLLRTWSFGPFREVLLQVERAATPPFVFSLGFERLGERALRSDDWGPAQPVQLLFWFMTSNAKKGLSQNKAVQPLPWTVEIPPPGGEGAGLVVHLDGTRYPADGPATAAEGSALAFVQQVLAVASSGSESELAELWQGEDRTKIEQMRSRSPGRFDGLRETFETAGPVRHLFTAELGELQLHYYVEQERPEVMRTMLLQRTGDGWSLAQGLHANVAQFMTSPLLVQSILELAAKEDA